MLTINMHEAKSQLSRLVESLESGAQDVIVIARNGKAAAKLVPIGEPDVSRRIGGGLALLGQFPSVSLEEWNALDADVASLFENGTESDHS